MRFTRALPYSVLLFLIFLLLILPARSAGGSSLPAWPQKLALINGEQVSFAIPVMSMGTITATASWQGVPLTLAFLDGQGKTVVVSKPQVAPKAVLEYKVTPQDLSRGTLWTVCVSTSSGPRVPGPDKTIAPTATGTLTATWPPANEAAVSRALEGLKPQRVAASTALTAKFKTKLGSLPPSAVQVPNPSRAAQLAKQEQTMRTRFTVASAVKPTPTNLEKITIRPVSLLPSIVSIAPTNGSSGDVVSVTTTLLADPGQTDVVFNFGKSSVVAEKTAPPQVKPDTGQVVIAVRVPKTTEAFAKSTNILIALVDRSRNPYYTSASANFLFDPFPAPLITGINPSLVPSNGFALISGSRFQSGAVAHFVLPGLGDVASTSTIVKSENTIQAKVPAFSTSSTLNGQLYIVGLGGKQSGPMSFSTEINQTAVSAVFPAQASSWETFMLSGTLLASVSKVTYAVRPRNQQPAGTSYVSGVHYGATAPRTLEIVQKSDAALLLRVPMLEGFSGPLTIDLTLTGSGKAVSVPFTILPDYVDAYYRVECTKHNFNKNEGSDELTTVVSSPYWLVGTRNSSWIIGHKGDDVFWSTPWRIAKEYNWTFGSANVEIMSMWASASLNSAGMTTVPIQIPFQPTIPAGSMWVSVHWWADAVFPTGGTVFYWVTVTLHGPKGVPMALSTQSGEGVMPDGKVMKP